MKTLDDVLGAELKELFSAQRQWLLTIPGMIRRTSNSKLIEHFRREARETKGHIGRIEQISGMLGISPRGRAHSAMRELVLMPDEIPEISPDGVISDARMIIISQRVAHLLICGYGTARALARVLGHGAVESLLTASLAEKEGDDRALTVLAVDLYASSVPEERVAPAVDESLRP